MVKFILKKTGAEEGISEKLSEKLSLEIIDEAASAEFGDELYLSIDAEGLSLNGQGQSIKADLAKMARRVKKGNIEKELLVRAAKIKNPEGRILTAIDATAGFGEDSILLAAAGFNVKLFERDPIIEALLEDGLRRAAEIQELAEIATRMEVFYEDSLKAMAELSERPDVILLDPMFPERQKSSLIKKKFQLLQQLESPCSDAEELFAAAVSVNPRKLVIKRALKGEFLAGKKPQYSLKGKSVRYDCFSFA